MTEDKDSKALITDLMGVGRATDLALKVIDVVQSVFGRVTKDHFRRKDAEAAAFTIDKVSPAVQRAAERGIEVQYKDESVTLTIAGVNPPPLIDRAVTREIITIAKEQDNLERITSYALEDTINHEGEPISQETVDPDFVGRFFDYGRLVYSDKMQEIWGKLLAGEVQNPGSFSLRTLDVLRNLSQHEALTFIKVAKYALNDATHAFVIYDAQKPNKFYSSGILPDVTTLGDVAYGELLLLIECGLLQSPLAHMVSFNTRSPWSFSYGSKSVYALIETIQVSIPLAYFSQAGRELLRLLEREIDLYYLYSIINYLQNNSAQVLIGSLEDSVNDQMVLVTPAETAERLAQFRIKRYSN